MPSALAVRELVKRYGAHEAVRGVSLEVAEGELVGLLGPNGAGKSTLVKVVCGLVHPTSGAAEVCGAPAGSGPARAALGYLAELFRFPGWCRADELLELHQRLAGSEGGEEEREAADRLYEELEAAGAEVLYDDRDAGPGEKLTDAELLGCPLRIVVGRRGLAEGVVEASERASGAEHKLPLEEAAQRAVELLQG